MDEPRFGPGDSGFDPDEHAGFVLRRRGKCFACGSRENRLTMLEDGLVNLRTIITEEFPLMYATGVPEAKFREVVEMARDMIDEALATDGGE